GDQRKHTDRLAKRQFCREQSDEERIQRGNAAPEIVGEALTRSAHPGRKQLGQDRSHARENAGGEKAERKAEQEHHVIVDRDLRIDEHGDDRANREQNEIRAPADPVVEPGAHQITDERAYDDNRDIAAAAYDRELAFGPEKRRKPGGDRIIPALRARREDTG